MPSSKLQKHLLNAIKPHVPLNGWSEVAFRAAISDADMDEGIALAICPRRAFDLALAFHEEGDWEMLDRLAETDLSDMRFRDRIATAVRYRLEVIENRELVRRSAALFSLPPNVPEGAQVIWNTCDKIWAALGDQSNDINWYTKRSMLSAVYGSTTLYWLGDESVKYEKTWAFLDRRIADVMRFEKIKAKVRENPFMKTFANGPLSALGRMCMPPRRNRSGMPGSWNRPE
ncbi:MAG: COQ9 family protein [Roseovarius sp.]|nr:COQ9 family protein [Roseovarius sp.]MCY4207401.1 COQ9 family protein [Roseovarius sp.]MCY4292601.1 COQ9 family protein [Roseovarius sp.]MCY4315543.1 COQ9 family protein [Roseovarius sp.]